ncbi:hypothetical protein [Paractinoplanes durhamensis]|uniref:hypothetical protein n=1 Tax=Paractinoplanes durhamensis TaxID=113563 RepID=UPI003644DCB0
MRTRQRSVGGLVRPLQRDALGRTPPGYPPPQQQPTYAQPGPPPPRQGTGNRVLLVLLALGTVALLGMTAVVVMLVRNRNDPGRDPVAKPPANVSTVLPTTTTAAPDPTTAGPAASPRDQAAKVDDLLDQSVASRAKLNAAIDKVRQCSGAAAALGDMKAVGAERTAQIAATEALDVSGLDNGAAIQSRLKAALGFALAADQAFVAWATPAAAGSCGDTAARGAAWDKGQAASKQAQAAKKQFVAVWNPVAGPLGFAERTTDKF